MGSTPGCGTKILLGVMQPKKKKTKNRSYSVQRKEDFVCVEAVVVGTEGKGVVDLAVSRLYLFIQR